MPLPCIQAVIPAARTPDFWKDFARVAGKSRKHSEVGAILPRLHDVGSLFAMSRKNSNVLMMHGMSELQ